MSCKHGNWYPCEECDAYDTAISEAFERGRQAEREECAILCEKSDRYRGDYFAAKIRNRERGE